MLLLLCVSIDSSVYSQVLLLLCVNVTGLVGKNLVGGNTLSRFFSSYLSINLL